MGIKSILLALLLCLTLQVNAQHFERELKQHKWLCTDGFKASDIFDWYIDFTDGKAAFVMKEKGSDKVVSNFTYNTYLVTDIAETKKFDYSLIDKNKYGRYIMMDREKEENGKVVHDTNIAEIMSISTDNLILFLNNKNNLTFKAVK